MAITGYLHRITSPAHKKNKNTIFYRRTEAGWLDGRSGQYQCEELELPGCSFFCLLSSDCLASSLPSDNSHSDLREQMIGHRPPSSGLHSTPVDVRDNKKFRRAIFELIANHFFSTVAQPHLLQAPSSPLDNLP